MEGAEAAIQGKEMSDEQVVERIRAGDSALYGVLVKRHQGRLYRLARRILRDGCEAEDALQEAHLRAITHLDQFAGRSKFSTWMTSITINEAFACLRKRPRREALDIVASSPGKVDCLLVSKQPSPEEQMMSSELRDLLGAAVRSLPRTQRNLLEMRITREMSVAEAAQRLGITEECAKARLHRARSVLRQRITQRASYRHLVPAA